MITAHKRAAVELMLTAAAGPVIDSEKLRVDLVPRDLAVSMQDAQLLARDPTRSTHWMLTQRAHAIINRIVSDAQCLLAHCLS